MDDSVLNWLLEDNNPAIKYRALTEICCKSPDEYHELYESVWKEKQIERMLQKQDENGLWSNKDWGVHTSLRYLTAFAEFGLHRDKRLDNFVGYTVNLFQEAAQNEDLAGCGTALTLRAMVMLGYIDEAMPLVTKFATAQLYDGGFMCRMKLEKKPDRKSCYKAAISALLLYSECKRKGILLENTDMLLEYFLKRDVFYSSDKSASFKEGRYGWRYVDNFFPVEPMRIGLPLIVAALSVLGAGDQSAVAESWELLNKKEDESGKLSLEGTLTKQPCSFGKAGQANKWVTFYSVLAEKYR